MDVAPLTEKNTVVTDAASGIGRELVLALSEAGANVLVVNRDGDGLSNACSPIVGRGTGILALALLQDGAETGVVQGAVDAFRDRDMLVNCAGAFPSSPALKLPMEEWDLVRGLNLRVPFLLSKAVARHMVSAGRPGTIVNVASAGDASDGCLCAPPGGARSRQVRSGWRGRPRCRRARGGGEYGFARGPGCAVTRDL